MIKKRKTALFFVTCMLLLLVSQGAVRVVAQQSAINSNGAQFISQSGILTTMQTGETRSVSITMRNTGTTTWTRAGEYKLGSQNPQDNTLWTGGTRVYLSTSDAIAPGQSKTFSFNITAPSSPGTYDFQWRMVHEGVEWFGDLTPNVRIVVESPTNEAQFVSQSVPTSLQPGETRSVSITMRNTGDTTWTRAGGYKLGTQNPQDNTLWTGGTRIYLSPSDVIAPGQSKTFTFDITAPDTPGTYDFQWRMVHEGVEWFGEFTPNVEITVVETPAPFNGAQFVSQDVPDRMQPGETRTVSITMRNTGTTTWTRADQYKLGTENPRDNTLWIGSTRVYLSESDVIAPGQPKTFTFDITAPSTPGIYNFQWRMVQDPVEWFGEFTANMQIAVEAPAQVNRAQFVAQDVPSQLPPGEWRSVSITLRNTGTTTWTRAGGYKLGTENPRDNILWTGSTRVYLSESDVIEPGQLKTFTFDIVAPPTPGVYDFQWRMVQDPVEWFGEFTPNVQITVVTDQPPPPPVPIRPGLWPASDEESSSGDLDQDGISQLTELHLAQAFFPTIWFDRGEDCTFPGGNKDRQPNQPGRLVFRVRPHPKNPVHIAITYVLLYARDCGDLGGIGSHHGDVEPFAITLVPDAECESGYRIYAIRSWAHEGTWFQNVDNDDFSNERRCRYGFSVDPTGRDDVVLAAENKHGNYLYLDTCDSGGFFGSDHCGLDFTLGDVNAWVGFNAGEPTAQRHRDLSPLGFPGEEMWAGRPFCGGLSRSSSCPGAVEQKLADKFVAATFTTETGTDDTQFIDQAGLPTTLQPGQQATVFITMKNVGSTVWTQAAGHRLGSQNPRDNIHWGIDRVELASNEMIAPNEQKTFAFTITAPATPGVYNFQWQMLREGVHWFGDLTPNVRITVEAPAQPNGAQFVSQTVPDRLQPGETRSVSITMRNTGTTAWTQAAGYKLGTQNPQDNTLWTGSTRVYLSASDAIAPGQSKTFTFDMTAPSSPGTYNFQWRMVHEGVEWFGEYTPNVVITVGRNGGGGNCPEANPNDDVPDDAALQACLDRGGTVELIPGNPGYIIAAGIKITVDGTILTSAQAPTKATLVAHPDLFAPLLEARNESGFTIEHLIFDGSKSSRRRLAECTDAPGVVRTFGSNIIIGGARNFFVRQIEARNAMCGTALQINGSDFEVAHSVFANNGFSRDQVPEFVARAPWSDGITLGKCERGLIHHNTLTNNTDIAIVTGGGAGCRIEDNTISQTNVRAFAGLAIHFFDAETDGTHIDAVFRNNTVTSVLNGLDLGISVGMHPWRPDLETKYGSIVSNTVSGAVVNLAVDGYAFGTVRGNVLSNPQGNFSHNINCPGFSANYTVAHTRSADLQGGWVSKAFDQGTSCESPIVEPPSAWEDDDFDGLNPGPLHGQNGWTKAAPDRASAVVVPDPVNAGGNILKIDAAPGATIVMGKDVPNLTSGRHRFELDVMVADATEASLAKIEVRTDPATGWDKKFQIYFGSSMRVNYSRSGAAAIIVPETQMGHWYHLRFELNLETGLLDVWEGNNLVASNLPMHPGPVTDLGLSGWDRPGAVYFDNLLGTEQTASSTVNIIAPTQGATVSGIVSVRTEASADVTRVEFYVDGVLQSTDATRPYEYAWDTTVNPLPVPNHAMDFGYYFVEWKNPADFDTARAEVEGYTNLYYASRSSYVSDLGPAEWRPLLAQSLANAQAENKRIHLALESEELWDDVLDVAARYWGSVSRIEIEDEPSLTRLETEAMIQRLKAKLAARGLAHRPMGFVYVYNQPLPDAINAPSLDWVGIEAYLDYPGSPVSQVNIDVLNAYLQTAKAQVPAGKQIILVMMAYDRNGNWSNIDALRDLQIATYLQAHDDPRVIAITMFAYTRQGGSRDHPELKTPHKLIGERILARPVPLAGDGPRTLTVKGYDAAGNSVMDRITVTIITSLADSDSASRLPSTHFAPWARCM